MKSPSLPDWYYTDYMNEEIPSKPLGPQACHIIFLDDICSDSNKWPIRPVDSLCTAAAPVALSVTQVGNVSVYPRFLTDDAKCNLRYIVYILSKVVFITKQLGCVIIHIVILQFCNFMRR